MKTKLNTDKMPLDQLATLGDDSSLLMLGIIPVVVVVVVGIVFAILYFYRRSKNWNDLGEAMRLDDGDEPIANSNFDTNFNTQNISRMDPTMPAKRFEDSRNPEK